VPGAAPGLERYGRYVLIDMRDLERTDRWFTEHGEATAFFSRLLPVVRTVISVPAGVSRMNLTRWGVYTFVGAALRPVPTGSHRCRQGLAASSNRKVRVVIFDARRRDSRSVVRLKPEPEIPCTDPTLATPR
jgi:hypothetical protein